MSKSKFNRNYQYFEYANGEGEDYTLCCDEQGTGNYEGTEEASKKSLLLMRQWGRDAASSGWSAKIIAWDADGADNRVIAQYTPHSN